MSTNPATVQITFPKEGFFLYLDGQNHGPFTVDEILKKFDAKEVERTTPIWFPGLANWITVADLPDLDRRQPSATSVALPQKDRADDLIVQLKNHAMSLKPQSVKALVSNEDLRRTDLAYDDNSKTWIRSDQHPVIRAFYSMPAAPNPLPGAANIEAKPATATIKRFNEQGGPAPAPATNAKAAAPAPKAKSGIMKVVLYGIMALLTFIAVAYAIWNFLPAIRKLIGETHTPASIQPAGLIALPNDEFGITEETANEIHKLVPAESPQTLDE